MHFKEIVRIVLLLGLFFLVIPYLFRLFGTPVVEVGYDTAVAGKVTGNYMNRQYYVHYLNDNTKKQYDFNRFLPTSPLLTGLSQEEINQQSLGHYLRNGDLISKTANDVTLIVQRAGSTSQWVCSSRLSDK